MRVALAQMNIHWENKESNYRKCKEFVAQAKKHKCDIVFFPEMCFTGFSMNTEKIAEENHETLTEMKRIARRYKIGIGFGWVKKADYLAENHYSVVSAEGSVLSDYIKIHPFSYGGEDKYYSPGNQIVQFEYGGMTFSTFICYDLRFPEIFQIASAKTEVIVVPANWPKAREDHWKTLLKARAIENQCYILGVNCVGTIDGLEYSGRSAFISPNGIVLTESEEKEQLLCYNLDDCVSKIRDEFPVKKDRKEHIYFELSKNM